jgi:branched-chain amino acid transport system substrate-binding protein
VNRRAAAIVVVAALALAAGGCAGKGGTDGAVGRETLTVYVSAPLHGQRAAAGRAIVDGAKLALADAGGKVGELTVQAVYLDDTRGGRWSLSRTAANARRASEDVTAIGYLGDLDSGATRASVPITNQAEIVQISPGSTAVDLTRLPPVGSATPERLQPSDRKTFARVVPADDVEARAAALWAKRIGVKTVDTVNEGSDFGRTLVAAYSGAARRLGLDLRRGPEIRGTLTSQNAIADLRVDAVYYGGTADGALTPLRRIAGAAPKMRLFGSDALIDAAFLRGAAAFADRLYLTSPFVDPSLLPPEGQRFLRAYRKRFGHRPDPAAAYGYESMALLLDAIRRAGGDGDDRDAVIDEVLSTQDRHSVLGTYSIDGNGDTTLDTVSGYRVSDGLPVFPVQLKAPR